MTHRLRRAAAASIMLCCLSGQVRAEGFDPRLTPEEEQEANAGIHLPRGMDQAEFAAESSEPLPFGNESPGQVSAELEELQDARTMSEFLEPQDAAVIDKRMELAKLRLAIATRREQRNKLRKLGKKREAETLDVQINELKLKLKAATPKGKTGLAQIFQAKDED